MARFDDDTLNPEEEAGGFQAQEQGDESFKLSGLDEYPGDLPQMISGDDKLIYQSDNADDDSEDASTASEEEGEAGEDENEAFEGEGTEEGEDIFAGGAAAQADEDWDLMDDSEDDVLGDEGAEGEESESSMDDYGDIFGDEPVEKGAVSASNPALTDEPVNDDLKELLNSELERSKSRKDKSSETEGEEEPVFDAADYQEPTGEEGTVAEMDFADIPGDRPSTYGLEDVPKADTPPPAQEKEKKEKKKRSPLFWPLVAGIGALLMLGTALVTYFLLTDDESEERYEVYLQWKGFGFEFDIPEGVDTTEYVSERMEDFLNEDGSPKQDKIDAFINSKEGKEQTAQNKPTQEEVEDGEALAYGEGRRKTDSPNEMTVTDEFAVNTDNPFRGREPNPDSEIDNYIQSQNELSVNDKQTAPVQLQEPPKPKKNNPFRDNEKENTNENVNSVEESPKTVAPVKKKPSPSKAPKPTETPAEKVAEKPLQEKAEDVADNSSNADDLLEKIRQRKNSSATDESGRSYTVQVFSTLSKEDAEIWREKLDNRKVGKAYISEHVIRDQTWYRVRVGDYPSREEALMVARKLGYAQVWVDRVK